MAGDARSEARIAKSSESEATMTSARAGHASMTAIGA